MAISDGFVGCCISEHFIFSHVTSSNISLSELLLYTLIGSHTLQVNWYHKRAAPTSGTAHNCVLVPTDFATLGYGYYPRLGFVKNIELLGVVR